MFDAAPRCGGWEEVWRSLELIEYFDLDAVIEHARRRETAVTAARVGFFLEQHREELMVEESHLEALRGLVPAQPRYIGPEREPGRLVRAWNLVASMVAYSSGDTLKDPAPGV